MAADKEKEIRYKNILFLEKEREKEHKIEGDVFTLIAPFPREYDLIARDSAANKNGLPASSFDQDALFRFERNAAIRHLVRGPDWWKGPHSSPSDEFLDELYRALKDWDEEFQEGLKKNRFGRSVD